MTEPDPEVIDDVRAFVDRHDADPRRVKATGLRGVESVRSSDADAIAAALDHVAGERNGEVDDG
jgi:hypothetical protein